MTRGLGGSTLGLFGGMLALEIAYALYVAKIRKVFDNTNELKTADNENTIDLTEKQYVLPTPPASLIETLIKPETKVEKPNVETSSKTVYSTGMDSSSSLHISIIINTPKPPSNSPTKCANCTKSEDEFKNINKETDLCASNTTVVEEKKNDYLNSEKLREILITSSNTQEHHENTKDASKITFSNEDDMFVAEAPFRLDNKMKMNEKYDLSSHDIINSRKLENNTSVTLKCNESDNIEVIAVTASPNDVERKWHTNTPLLIPK